MPPIQPIRPLGLGSFRAASQQQDQQLPPFELSEDQTESLLKKYARGTLGGIARVGNTLDLVGSMSRDIIGGEDPFDQLGSISQSDNRLTGRDLGRKWGWFGPEDSIANWWGGFGLEVAADPLTYLTLGGAPLVSLGRAALTKSGKAMRHAGLLEDVADFGRTVGQRSAMMRTPEDVFSHIKTVRGDDALVEARKKFAATGASPTKRMGGSFGLGLPFMDPIWAPSLPKAASRAKAYDEIGEKILDMGGNYQPFRHLQTMFRPSLMGGVSPEMQKVNPRLFRERERISRDVESEIMEGLEDLPVSQSAKNIAAQTGEDARAIQARMERDILENVGGEFEGAPEFIRTIAAKHAAHLNELELMGVYSPGELEDIIQFAHRQLDPRVLGEGTTEFRKGSGSGPWYETSGADRARAMHLKGFHGGTNAVNKLYTHEPFEAIAQDVINGNIDRATGIERAADQVVALQGEIGRIEPFYIKNTKDNNVLKLQFKDGNKNVLKTFKQTNTDVLVENPTLGSRSPKEARIAPHPEDEWHFLKKNKEGDVVDEQILKPDLANRHKELAEDILESPGARKFGLFNNHWAADAMSKLTRDAERVKTADLIYDTLSKYSEEPVPLGRHSIKARDILKKLGLNDTKGGYLLLGRKLKKDPDYVNSLMAKHDGDSEKALAEALESVLDSTIDERIARDLTMLWPNFAGPIEITSIGKFMDAATSLFKVGVLTWPARYMRDLVSGIARNVEAGLLEPWDIRYHADAHNMIQGRTLKGYKNSPLVKEWMAARGWDPTDENATRAIRHIYARYGPGTHRAETDLPVDMEAQQLDDLLGPLRGREKGSEAGSVARFLDTAVRGPKAGKEASGIGDAARQAASGMLPFWRVRGIGGRAQHEWGPAAAGDIVGRYTDDMVRLTPMLKAIKQGVDPEQFMRSIREAQVSYDPRHYTASDRILRRVFPFWRFCMPLDHEIMTREGFKKYDEVIEGEEVLTLNHDTGELEWQPLEGVNVFDYSGEMHYCETRQGKLEYTPEHRWPIIRKGISEWAVGEELRTDDVVITVDEDYLPDHSVIEGIGKFNYQGQVWCPTTPNGTWVCRHDGAVVITGNSSRQIPWLTKNLVERPGGRLSHMVQTAGSAADPDIATPDYVSETASIPMNQILGEPKGGGQRFLTGLGLMWEDPLSFVSANPQMSGQEVISRMSPYLKAPFEYSSGTSFFQKGPQGGRPLQDADPLVGRLLAMAYGDEDAWKTNQNPFGLAMEVVAANSPLSRTLTTLRTAADPRKTPAVKALNTLTGVRVHDISLAAQEAMLREAIEDRMRRLGGRTFERTYIPTDLILQMNPEKQVEALGYNALINELAQRAKGRAEPRGSRPFLV